MIDLKSLLEIYSKLNGKNEIYAALYIYYIM